MALGRGIALDFRGRLKCYADDWRQGGARGHHIIAPSLYIFFASALPALAFGQQLAVETEAQLTVVHVLVSTALAGFLQVTTRSGKRTPLHSATGRRFATMHRCISASECCDKVLPVTAGMRCWLHSVVMACCAGVCDKMARVCCAAPILIARILQKRITSLAWLIEAGRSLWE